jgi:hypothetical protein
MMDRLPRFRGRQISGALYAISRLNLYNAELVGALVQVRETQVQPCAARWGFAASGLPSNCQMLHDSTTPSWWAHWCRCVRQAQPCAANWVPAASGQFTGVLIAV